MTNKEAPLYVKIGLLGIGSRATAMAYMLICIFLALGLTVYLSSPIGLALLLAAYWYWIAIKWMDANDGWNKKSS